MRLTGNHYIIKKIFFCLSVFFLTPVCKAQLQEFNISNKTVGAHTSKHHSSRVQETSPLLLPFWDDFSYPIQTSEPNVDLWFSSNTVTLNNGLCINPPSKNVVTFDGRNEHGKPYNTNDILAKGWADSLVSQPIRMDLVERDLKHSTYLSFFYQVKGLGENPDAGDLLCVYFKDADNQWEMVEKLENNDSLKSDTFYQILIPVIYDKFFHDDFQFMIKNFARLSGPYDNWNVDYIYLNKGRYIEDKSFPDRTISSPMGSLFNDYYSIPAKHFLQNVTKHLKAPTLTLYNLRANNPQPFNYSTTARITQKIYNQVQTKVIPLEIAKEQDEGKILNGLQFLQIELKSSALSQAFDLNADSIGIEFKYEMATNDNTIIEDKGDYDPKKYEPIDFRVNDSTYSNYVLSSYYAYDDGTAEYGAGLSQSGAMIAYKFSLKHNLADTLVYVDIYFPNFDDNSSQSLQLQIRTELSDDNSSLIYNHNVIVERTADNIFTRYRLNPAVIVDGEFFVGIKLLNNVSIPIGLDKNSENSDKVYYNTNGKWIQNTTVNGSLMIRPGFGNAVISEIPQKKFYSIYPNPTSKRCFLPLDTENIHVYDMFNRKKDFNIEITTDFKILEFISPVNGIIFVSYVYNGQNVTERVMVLKEQ